MDINSSAESCRHIVILTLPFSEIKQTHATLCSADVASNISHEFLRAGCDAASQWEPSQVAHREWKGCFALNLSYKP